MTLLLAPALVEPLLIEVEDGDATATLLIAAGMPKAFVEAARKNVSYRSRTPNAPENPDEGID